MSDTYEITSDPGSERLARKAFEHRARETVAVIAYRIMVAQGMAFTPEACRGAVEVAWMLYNATTHYSNE